MEAIVAFQPVRFYLSQDRAFFNFNLFQLFQPVRFYLSQDRPFSVSDFRRQEGAGCHVKKN
jgi:hypothetical protein